MDLDLLTLVSREYSFCRLQPSNPANDVHKLSGGESMMYDPLDYMIDIWLKGASIYWLGSVGAETWWLSHSHMIREIDWPSCHLISEGSSCVIHMMQLWLIGRSSGREAGFFSRDTKYKIFTCMIRAVNFIITFRKYLDIPWTLLDENQIPGSLPVAGWPNTMDGTPGKWHLNDNMISGNRLWQLFIRRCFLYYSENPVWITSHRAETITGMMQWIYHRGLQWDDAL